MKALSLGFNLNIKKIQLELFNFSVCLWVEEDLLYAGLGSICVLDMERWKWKNPQ